MRPGVVTKGYGALDWTVDVDGFLVDTTSAANSRRRNNQILGLAFRKADRKRTD